MAADEKVIYRYAPLFLRTASENKGITAWRSFA